MAKYHSPLGKRSLFYKGDEDQEPTADFQSPLKDSLFDRPSVFRQEWEAEKAKVFGSQRIVKEKKQEQAQPFASGGIEDKTFVDASGKYCKSYSYFAGTSLGQQFLLRFTNGKDSRWNFLQGEIGDLSHHIFRIIQSGKNKNITNRANTKIYLQTAKGKEISLEKLNTNNITEKFRVVLQVTVNKELSYDRRAAGEIGHEVFLHIYPTLNQLEIIDRGKAYWNKKQIAQELRFLRFIGHYYDPQEKILILGGRHHAQMAYGLDITQKTYIESVYHLLKIKKSKVASEAADLLKQDYLEQKAQYTNNDLVQYAVKKGVFKIAEKYNFYQYEQDQQKGIRIAKYPT